MRPASDGPGPARHQRDDGPARSGPCAASASLLQEGLIDWQRLLGPRQITDAYLLALAVCHGGRFATFDQRIPVEVVPSARAADLCVIAADATGPTGS